MIKKLLCTLLSILLLIPAFGYFNHVDVLADGGYEVAYIEDNGNFKTIATYSDFATAKNKMKENADYVVRHGNSRSPSKIIAMNSGFVFSYPYRRGYSTMNIYETVNSSLVGSGVTTYVAEHYEMKYHSTYYYYESKGYGYVEVTLNGFHGYCDLEYTDLVPTKFIEKNIPITLGGGDITGSNEQPFSVKIKQNYYYVNENNGYRDLVFVYHRAWSKNNGGDCLEYSLTIGVAPDFMKVESKYYSNDGVNFYSDTKQTNKVGMYYNYYQFLPLRTKTNISANTMNSFIANNTKNKPDSVIKDSAQSFINAQNRYGCNAATILAMAIHESGWGDSPIAKGKYNLFGWGAFDDATSNATRYGSVEECVNAQMADNLANYMDVKCARYFSMSLGNKGGGFILKYASDPYWAEKIAGHYYSLDKYSGGNANGKLTDYNTYNLSLVSTKNVPVKSAPNGNTLYTTANKSGYQKNLVIVNLGEENGYTKTQTSDPIINGSVVFPIELPRGTLVDYDYNSCVGYISSNALVSLSNTAKIVEPEYTIPADAPNEPEKLTAMVNITKFDLNCSVLSLAGDGFINKVNFNVQEGVSHKLVLKDASDETNEFVYDLTTSKKTVKLNDGYIYDYVGFAGDVNINELPMGNYNVYLRITNKNYTKDISISSPNDKYYNKLTTVNSSNGNVTYRLTTNELYSYRFELEITSSPFDYTTVNKPSMNRTSLFNYTETNIDDECNLKINGYGMIYYLNYNQPENIKYEVYLVKNAQEYVLLDTKLVASKYNYASLLGSSFNMDNICFEATGNIKDLDGEYKLILKVSNKVNNVEYIDFIEMIKESNSGLASNVVNGRSYEIRNTNVRNRTVLVAADVPEEGDLDLEGE